MTVLRSLMVKRFSRKSGDRRTDRRTDGRTLPSTLSVYFAVDKNGTVFPDTGISSYKIERNENVYTLIPIVTIQTDALRK